MPVAPPCHSAGSTSLRTYPPHPTKNNSNRWLLVGGGIILVILLCASVGGIVFHLAPAHKPIPTPIQIRTNCISCTVLEKAMHKSGKTINISELDVKQENNKLLCCLKTTSRSDTFLEMLLEDARQSGALAQAQDKKAAHEDNTSHEVSALPPPDIAAPRPVATPTPHQTFKRNLAAALVGLEKKIPVGVSDRELYTLKEWGVRTRRPVTFIRREIKYDERRGYFKMPRDGLYIINVHLGLSNTNKTDINFGQQLLRYNHHFPGTDQEVLAFDSEKIPASERRTSSLSSVFNLRKDDEIFVQVAPARAVVDDSSRSYLSVFLLSE